MRYGEQEKQMNIVKPHYEIINEPDPIKKIERAARTCYKSEDKITDESAERMVRALVKREHFAMLEHASIILESLTDEIQRLVTYFSRGCGRVVELRITDYAFSGRSIISGNMRAWLEFFKLCISYNETISEDLASVFLKQEYVPIFDLIDFRTISSNKKKGFYIELTKEDLDTHEMLVHYDLTVKFICDRGVSHEIVRHRKASYAQESTRYCSYESDGISVIEPSYLRERKLDFPWLYNAWKDACEAADKAYNELRIENRPPQEARAVLPTSLKTELVMTANLMEWRHFFKLRALGTTGKPHPQIEELAGPLLEELNEQGGKLAMVFGDLATKWKERRK